MPVTPYTKRVEGGWSRPIFSAPRRCSAKNFGWIAVTPHHHWILTRTTVKVEVDGKSLIRSLVFQDTIWERSYFGSDAEHEGTLNLSSVGYKIDNPSDHSHSYEWQAASGEYPNQYEIDHWLELDYNSNPNPDHGYSSWVQLPDGRIFVADYTNEDSPPGKACLKGYFLRPEELNL